MQIDLTFLGASQNVTGSKYLIQANGAKVLIDCGIYQERQLKERNYLPFPVQPDSIDAVVLTHAHLDHTGLLPKLVRDGFKGRIYATPATSEITKIVLLDAAHLQEEDAEFKRKRHQKEGRTGPYPVFPLYTTEDASACFDLFEPSGYETPIEIANGVEATFYNAGHILGSSNIGIRVPRNRRKTAVLFSGDIGRADKPILQDPEPVDNTDYIVMESTYGDRKHDLAAQIELKLADVINRTHKTGGNIVIPSFAVERAQEILYHLNSLLRKDLIPHLMVFLDSPMAGRVTEVFKKHVELYDEEMASLVKKGRSPFDFPGLKITESTEESKAINHIKGTSIIIAGSGMCTGGRIKHHLVNNITRPESTILFVGYQATGTLGRQIVQGSESVRILGQKYEVKAHIAKINGFSSHADREELLGWLKTLKKPPKHIFVTHGEAEVAKNFAKFITKQTTWEASAPAYMEKVRLS
ncbi:MAG: MBL fold metallo-hydrolase [Planctomycetota bacterium]